MRGRVWGPLAIAIALASMTAGGIVISQDGGGGGDGMTANLWISEDGGPCTYESTPIEFDAAKDCDTFVEACIAADVATSGGGTIYFKSGTYPGEQVYRTASAGQAGPCDFSSQTTFAAQPGETVTLTGTWNIGDVNVGAGIPAPSNLKLLDLIFDEDEALTTIWNAPNMVVDNIQASQFDWNGPSAFDQNGLIVNSTFKGCFGTFGVTLIGCITRIGGSGITSRNNDYYDFHSGTDAGYPDCVSGGSNPLVGCPRGVAILMRCTEGEHNNVTIEKNRFWNVSVTPIRVQPLAGVCSMTNTVIRNNWFGCMEPGNGRTGNTNGSIAWDAEFEPPKIYGNTMCGNVSGPWGDFFNPERWEPGSEIRGNILVNNRLGADTATVPAPICADADATFRYNLRIPLIPDGGGSDGYFKCHSTEILAPYDSDVLDEYVVGPTWGTNMDMTLKASTLANNAWLASDCSVLTADYFGTSRPLDTNCDIGADERDD